MIGMAGRTFAGQVQALRARTEGTAVATILLRLVIWRLCILLGLRPVIRAHGHARMRITPARGDHGIAKAVFLLRDRYEPSVRSVIDATLAEGDVAMDIGANMGLWTLRMAERVGDAGQVIAFEPGPLTQVRLRDNIALSQQTRVIVHGLALGAEPGELTLHTPGDSGSASLGAMAGATVSHRVRVERLDTIWQAAGSPQVRLVKMDVEGAEPMVLAGAVAFFAACRPVVCCEINPEALARLGFAGEHVRSFFRDRGYLAMIWNEMAGRLEPNIPSNDPDTVEDIVFMPEERCTTPHLPHRTLP